MVYCAGKLIENLKLIYKSNRPHFYGFTGVIAHAGCWENTRKACKSRAEIVIQELKRRFVILENYFIEQ